MFILNLTCASILMCYVNTIKVNTCVYFMFAWQLDRISTATILAEILRRSSYQQKHSLVQIIQRLKFLCTNNTVYVPSN